MSDFSDRASLFVQLVALASAIAIGRRALNSRSAIWGIALLGAFVAMAAHIVVDGQGAFALLFWAPAIYFASVIGRRDLLAR